jgi:hypothetical protein
MQHNINLAHRPARPVQTESELPVTSEYVRLAAAAVCARALHRLAHPSGTEEALVGQSIASTLTSAVPRIWSDLPPDVFTDMADQAHRLVSQAAEHTYLATAPRSSAASFSAPRHWNQLLPAQHSRWATGTDIRHEAVSLAQALIDDELHDGVVFGPLLHTPIQARHTHDGRPASWNQLPVRHLAPTLGAVERSVAQARHRIHTAVDAAVLDLVPHRERTSSLAQARSTAGRTVPSPEATAPPTPPAPSGSRAHRPSNR